MRGRCATRYLFRHLVVGAVALLIGCTNWNRKPDNVSTLSTPEAAFARVEVTQTLDSYFQDGLKRPFGPGGPRFKLPTSYYAYFASHLSEAAQFIDGKLVSSPGAKRTNAYDIVAHMGQFASSRAWALSKMKQAIHADDPVKFMIQPAYDQITKSATP